jgi:hypothetical protein
MRAGSGGLPLNRSRLALELDLPSIDPMIVPPSIAREVAGVTQDFWERQLAQGKLLGVTYLPGFVWMHTRILEAWFEAVPSSVLKANRAPDWREQLLWRQCPFLFRRNDWLKSYARALTNHALTTGYLVRGRCLICGQENADAHHPDYTKPLSVTWLCRRHHSIHHARIRVAENLVQRTGAAIQMNLLALSRIKERPKQFCENGHRLISKNGRKYCPECLQQPRATRPPQKEAAK